MPKTIQHNALLESKHVLRSAKRSNDTSAASAPPPGPPSLWSGVRAAAFIPSL